MNTRKQWNAFFAIEREINYEQHLQATRSRVLQCGKPVVPKPSLSFMGLVRRQVGFLAWKIWLMQGMVLASLCALFLSLYTYGADPRTTAALPKLLCCCSGIIAISAVPILKRSHRYHMAEVEQSTRFSLGGNVLSQLLFIAAGDLCMLSVLGIYVAVCGLTGSVIFISLVIPFLTCATAGIMLWVRAPFPLFERTVIPCGILSSLSMCALIEWCQNRYGSPIPAGMLGIFAAYTLLCALLLYRECRRLHLCGNLHKLP